MQGIDEKSTTKSKIIEASRTLFCEFGYKGTSVRKIASCVGIRESALYNHFKNKEQIFLEVANDIFSTPFGFKSAEIKEMAIEGKLFLLKFAMEYKSASSDKENENMFRLLMIEIMHNKTLRERFMREFYDKNIQTLSEGFFIMMQNNLVRSNDPMLMAYEFLSTLFFIQFETTLLRLDSKSLNHLDRQFEKHIDFFWESIKIAT